MATYYVDFTGGLDTNDGLTATTAWKTVTKVVAEMATYVPDDKILFKYGETFGGVQLAISCSGTNGHPITFGAYGDPGDGLPVIDGEDTVTCVQANNQSRLRFENIYAYQGLNSGFQFNTCTYIDVVDCRASDAGNDNLIFITECAFCLVDGGSYHDAYPREGTTLISGIEVADGSHDIDIIGARVYTNGTVANNGYGITIHSHATTGLPYNVRVLNCEIYSNFANGIQVYAQDSDATFDTNNVIAGNQIYDNVLDGIRVFQNNGHYPAGVDIVGNRCINNVRYQLWLEGDNSEVYYNTFAEFDGAGRAVILDECIGVNFYNNVSYANPWDSQRPIYIQGARTDGVNVKNNLFWCFDDAGVIAGTAAGATTNVVFDYNSYYHSDPTANRWIWGGAFMNFAAWQAAGRDTHGQAGVDPLIRNETEFDFRLFPQSPCVNVGEEVGVWYRGHPDIGIGYKPVLHKGFAFIE